MININILLLNLKIIKREYLENIKKYLLEFDFSIYNHIEDINMIINIFDNLKIDKSKLIDVRKRLILINNDNINSIIFKKIEIDVCVMDISKFNYIEALSTCLKYIPIEKESNFINLVKTTETNYIETNMGSIEMCEFKLMVNQLVNKVDDIFIKDISDELIKSNIDEFYKNHIYKTIMNNDLDLIYKIDTLSTKFEGIIRNFLKDNNISTEYINYNKSEESTLSLSKNGLLYLLTKNYNQYSEEIKLLNLILNDRIFYNIRNRSCHSFIDGNFYSEFNYKLLIICLKEIINIVK